MKALEIVSKKHGKHIAYFDDDDFTKISAYKWNIRRGRNTYYATANVYKEGKRVCDITMHRLVMNFPKAFVDHKDGNGLNNVKSNLRECTPTENNRNCQVAKNSYVGYKGVRFHKRDKLFFASIGVNYKRIHLGYFKKAEDAAIAYNEAAKKYFGDFAKLNVIKTDG